MSSAPPADTPRPLRGLRPRRTVAVWVCWLLLTLSLWGQHRLGLLPPSWVLFLALTVALVGLALIAAVEGLWRAVRGPKRLAALAGVMLALVPLGLLAYPGLYTRGQWQQRRVPANLLATLGKMTGVSLMCAEADLCYRHRLETERLVMYYQELATPQEDARAMDKHLARLEKLTGRPVRRKIPWVRGSLLGQGRLSVYGLALGSDASPADWSPAAPEGLLDRHELAHAFLDQWRGPDSDPPMLLHEGWAEAQSGLTAVELARRAVREKRLGRPHRVSELVSGRWYHWDNGPVYWVGGAFVDFLLRRHGAATFVRLYVECRPDTFAADCQAILGTSLGDLEAQFWSDAEQLGRDADGAGR
jgi:hypothetical protein